jgi:hypothetical protein
VRKRKAGTKNLALSKNKSGIKKDAIIMVANLM